jgi:hypothetical protein
MDRVDAQNGVLRLLRDGSPRENPAFQVGHLSTLGEY